MANCLVTKLKEAVGNTSLLKMGELKIHVGASTANCAIKSVGTKKAAVRASKSVLQRMNGSSPVGEYANRLEALEDGAYLYFRATEECDIFIEDKYSIIYLDINSALSDVDLKYIDSTDLRILFSNFSRTVYNIPNQTKTLDIDNGNAIFNGEYPYMQSFSASSTNRNVQIDLDYIGANFPALIRLNLWSDNITGNLTSLANCKFGTSGIVASAIAGLTATSIEIGSLEQFALNASVEEGSTMLSWVTRATFQGQALAGAINKSFRWRNSSVSGAVKDIQYDSTAIAIDSSGNKVADVTPW